MTRRRHGGFTLLEMLVSLMVFASVAALVYGMVRVASRSWEASMARIDDNEALRIGWGFVQMSLGNSRPEPSASPEVTGVQFAGNAFAVQYVADLPAYVGVGGLHLLSLQLDSPAGPGPQRLVLRLVPLPSGEAAGDAAERPTPVQEAVLAEGVRSLDIHYYGAAGEEEQPRWHREWRQQEALPTLVRIDVSLDDGGHWPVLVAHPRLQSAAAARAAAEAASPVSEDGGSRPAAERREARPRAP